MIINFLQQREPPILPVLHQMHNEGKEEDYFFNDLDQLRGFGSENYESLGGLLFAFFRRYAIEFDYDNQVISVRQGRYLTKAEKGWDTGRNKISLCVEEPCNVSRNLGNSADVGSVRGLVREFQRFLDLLKEGESLDKICTPYQPILFTTVIPPVSLKLPNHTSTIETLQRRKSMVDNRYNSSQPRMTRLASHPLPPVPSRLLSMLNINPNHGTDQSVDKIFARYHDPVKNNRRNEKRKPRSDWPAITPPAPSTQQPHRPRRWSKVEKKPTLAEIVKVHLPPSKPITPPPNTAKKSKKPSRKKQKPRT